MSFQESKPSIDPDALPSESKEDQSQVDPDRPLDPPDDPEVVDPDRPLDPPGGPEIEPAEYPKRANQG
jgi:hypothetical protein